MVCISIVRAFCICVLPCSLHAYKTVRISTYLLISNTINICNESRGRQWKIQLFKSLISILWRWFLSSNSGIYALLLFGASIDPSHGRQHPCSYPFPFRGGCHPSNPKPAHPHHHSKLPSLSSRRGYLTLPVPQSFFPNPHPATFPSLYKPQCTSVWWYQRIGLAFQNKSVLRLPPHPWGGAPPGGFLLPWRGCPELVPVALPQRPTTFLVLVPSGPRALFRSIPLRRPPWCPVQALPTRIDVRLPRRVRSPGQQDYGSTHPFPP